MTFALNAKQLAANDILAGPQMHTLLYGGSRSGKTLLFCRAIAFRAMKAEESRHGIFRFRFNHVKESIGLDTWPKMMRLCFPEVPYEINKSDWFITFPTNKSEIWLGGLDDKDRTEKVLGKEFATILLNECSQIAYSSAETVMTRLAQKTKLRLRAYYDENPPKKGHWTYRKFFKKVDPVSGQTLADPQNYTFMQINPEDNADNLAPEYLGMLRGMSGARRKRFLDGEFADDAPNALWSPETFDKHRVLDGRMPDLQRIVIAVDPSGASDTDNADNDAIGIVVVGLGTDGNAYLVEDLTIKAGPATWGKVVGTAFDRHQADCVVGETNYGGAMVKHVIQTARPDTPFRAVTASRGKAVRAEPISALSETGKIRHVGYFPELEDELTGFTTTGYTGEASPNRADAFVWAVTELFPGLTRAERKADSKIIPMGERLPTSGGGWMAA
jgi:hypothetical protein